MEGKNYFLLNMKIPEFEKQFICNQVSDFSLNVADSNYCINVNNDIIQKYYEKMYLSIIKKGLYINEDIYIINIFIDLEKQEIVDPDTLNLDVEEVKSFKFTLDNIDYTVLQLLKSEVCAKILQGADLTLSFEDKQITLYLEHLFAFVNFEQLRNLEYLTLGFSGDKTILLLADNINKKSLEVDILELNLKGVA